MICTIGMGSNLGDRRAQLEFAARRLTEVTGERVRVSPIYSTPALIPENGPASWRIPFLNAALQMQWKGTAMDLLLVLKSIESEAGRQPSERWAPRPLDLDLLFFGRETIDTPELRVPHPSYQERAFVLDPLKDLDPSFSLRARQARGHAPLWMGILNLTPDSFSSDGLLADGDNFLSRARHLDAAGVQILDVGAESTRPGATPLAPDKEWMRLREPLEQLHGVFKDQFFKPLLSVDTRHAATAKQALAAGADWINDVSGLSDLSMLDVLKESSCEYVLMHSLTVPADPRAVLHPRLDVVKEVKTWAEQKLTQLTRAGVAMERIIFDPGVGFGKTPQQSITLLKRIEEFLDLPVRILVGHSRKGFLRTWTDAQAPGRDPETLGVSLRLAERGVDVLRVHEPVAQMRAFHAFKEVL